MLTVVPSFGEAPPEKMETCINEQFPICLKESMVRIFGEKGKKALDKFVMNETFENTPVTSPRDISDLYEKYLERASNILGEDVGKTIGFESVNEMERMLCTKCPLFDKHSK